MLFARAIKLFLSGRRSNESLRTILALLFSQLLALWRARQLFFQPRRTGFFFEYEHTIVHIEEADNTVFQQHARLLRNLFEA